MSCRGGLAKCGLLVVALTRFGSLLPLDGPVISAGQTQQVGCTKWGYTFTVPANWAVLNRCSDNSGALGDNGAAIYVQVERKQSWTDQQSRTLISKGMHQNQTWTTAIKWGPFFPQWAALLYGRSGGATGQWRPTDLPTRDGRLYSPPPI